MLSVAPTRVKILSNTPMRAFAAGTKEPAWAMSTIRAVWRRRADLPAMLGPVSTMICSLRLSIEMSLGTYSSPGRIMVSMTGCLPALMSNDSDLSISGRE